MLHTNIYTYILYTHTNVNICKKYLRDTLCDMFKYIIKINI